MKWDIPMLIQWHFSTGLLIWSHHVFQLYHVRLPTVRHWVQLQFLMRSLGYSLNTSFNVLSLHHLNCCSRLAFLWVSDILCFKLPEYRTSIWDYCAKYSSFYPAMLWHRIFSRWQMKLTQNASKVLFHRLIFAHDGTYVSHCLQMSL